MSSPPEIRLLIVDDEAPARSRLRHLLRQEPAVRVLGECAGGAEAIEVIRRERPDAVLLDIQMPRITGFDVCLALEPEELPLVIFVTAFDEFALRAFEVHAIDYLLKPVDPDRLRSTLEHVRARLAERRPAPPDTRVVALLEEIRRSSQSAERLVLRVDGRLVPVRPETIEWVEADGNYVQIHAAGRSHMVRETLSSIEARLPAGRFVRISRSSIVNLDAVSEMQPLFYGDYTVLLRNGTKLTLSRTHRDRLRRFLLHGPERGG